MKRFLLIGWLCIGIAAGLLAQTTRPCVGLVLSGGGAKGFAHVGVLEVLDSLGIPVDMVAGTSMGAIIGGLYAIGYTPEMLHKVIGDADWSEINSSESARLFKRYEDRQREDKYLISTTIENKKIQIPGGLINGQKVHAKLNELTLGFHGNQNFLSFPRSFMCVATDLNSGTEFSFTQGNLADAMRASMAIPSVYQPFQYEQKWLIDGGIINNFPSDKLKAMGADIIIGVDVQTTFADTLSNPTVAKIIEKTSMYVNHSTSRERERICRLVIKPDMKGLSVSSFNDHEMIIQRGKEAARALLPELIQLKKQLGNNVNTIKPYQSLPDSVMIDGITIHGLKNVDRATVLQLMQVRKDQWVSPGFLTDRIRYAYGSGFFDQIQYQLIQLKDSLCHLRIDLKETQAAAVINFGFRYDNDFGVGILGNISKRNFLIKGTLGSIDLVIGETPRLRAEYLHTNLGFSSSFISTSRKFFLNRTFEGNVAQDYFSNVLFWKDVFKNNNSWGFGFEHEHHWINYKNVPVLRTAIAEESSMKLARRFNYLNLVLFSEGDKLDYPAFPTQGYAYKIALRLHKEMNWFSFGSSSDPFLMLNLQGRIVVPVTRTINIQPGLHSVLNFWNRPGIPYSVYLGGGGGNYFAYQIPFFGYRYQELGSLDPDKQNDRDFFQANATVISTDIQYRLWRKVHLTTILNAAFVGDTPENMALATETYAGFGLKLGLQTVIGPVELCFHQAFNQERPLLYFNIGFYY